MLENKNFPRKRNANRNQRMFLYLGDTLNEQLQQPKIKILVQNTFGLGRSKVKTPFDKETDFI